MKPSQNRDPCLLAIDLPPGLIISSNSSLTSCDPDADHGRCSSNNQSKHTVASRKCISHRRPRRRQLQSISRKRKRRTAASFRQHSVEKDTVSMHCGTGKDFLTSFPWEVATQILLFLDVKTLVTMSAVCKAWYALSRSNDIWRNRLKDMQWSVQVPKEFSQSKDRLDWHYIYKQKYQLEQRWATGRLHARYMFGHRESVYCVRFDDDVIISGSRDYTIKIWSTKTYECIRTLHGHDGSVLCLQFDKEKIISGSSDKTIIIWSLETFQILKRLRGHTGNVLDVNFNDTYIASCSKDQTIRLWDVHTGDHVRTILAHSGPVNALSLKDDRIVSAGGDAVIKMWDVTTGECIREYTGHTRGLACVQYDGKRIVSGSNDNTIKVWDPETGACLSSLEGHKALVRTLCFNDEKIVSGSYDTTIRVWDIRTGRCLLNFQSGHEGWVLDVRFDKSRILSAGEDNPLIVMDFSKGIDTRFIP
ncbi:hypothetical protein VTP01DRAFT_5404 [Rhizomucor pusillus]|uniref:uncharacterized protein n=1 Tax=Rhizomucor pusillus TaxID=4840 RepID=UPI003743A5C9